MTQVSKINGIPVVNTYSSGFTYNDSNVFTIANTDGTNLTATINQMSGLTVGGNFSATTIFSGGTDLSNIFAPIGGGGGGEVNTASNIGGGTGLFKQKSALDLQFRTLTGTSPSYKVTTAISGDTVTLDINEPNMTLWPLVVSGNQLISGGANLLSGLTFSVSPLVYIIGETLYNASASTVTLNSGGTTFDRIDVLYADISGATGFIQGTESEAPVKPGLDSATQVEVTFVTVAAGSATPEIAITKVYDEDTGTGGGEWDYSANTAVRISGDSTSTAFSGTKSIEFISAVSGDEFTMANPTPYDSAEDNTISFYIKNKTDWSGVKEFIEISFRDSGGTQNGSTVRFDEGKFGFDASNVFDWQVISIALGTFNMTSSMVSQVRFEVNKDAGASSSLELNIDLIRFQAGAPTTSPQNIWLSFLADDSNSATANSATDQLRLSGGSNINTAIIGKSAIFNLDDDVVVTSLDATTISGDTIYSGSTDLSSIFSTTSANIGGGEGVFSAKVGTVNQFKSLTSSGATIAITTSGDTINLESIAGTGQDNTASNVGGETGLFKQKTGVDLEFKTLSAGTNIQIFTGDSVVTISGPAGSGEANTGSNLGGGNPVFKQKAGVDLEFRTLVAGTNVTITSGATELTINASGGGGGGTSRITGATQTTTATPGEVDVIDTLVDNATNIVEVFVKAYESGAAEYGVWKRTLTVTSVSGTVVIREENADVDKTSSGLNANSINFTVNGSNIDIDVTGIAATTIDWVSAYEIII